MSWKEFTDRAVQANDKELVAKINIVEKYMGSLPGYIKILEEQAQYSIVDSRCVAKVYLNLNIEIPWSGLLITLSLRVDYIFSTVHKFKGLECDTVEYETFSSSL